ncbi:mevalonate kinase [Lactobacillus sp. ESL0684]|uniref:mevalonate kinase n=1 Tax=Lactobacillus sp. ESL0684 TaxID=2983213 RepID=UPI0023F8F17B|nr:mevalonate kinase [Lactobacillus sp. ESL0684]WEV44467.1 mevalonate kinase [Lactobacillus sp. ESL0684]
MKCSYSAHGKVILIGEHSVVYGYNALALPITSLQITATVEPSKQVWLSTGKYQGPFFAAPDEYNGLKFVVKTLLAKAIKEPPVKITYTGEIPIERGLGSSATVALATTKALGEYLTLNLTESDVMAITNQAEMINHGKASGIDAATVNSDLPIFFNPQTGAHSLPAKLKATLLIMDTGELGNTKQAVTQVRQQTNKSQTAQDNIKLLGQLTDVAKVAWLRQDQTKLGQVFNEAQAILHSFNLSTKKIDNLNTIALNSQALGFKLSGSGLGGIVIALCPNSAIAQTIALKSQGLITNYWIEEI